VARLDGGEQFHHFQQADVRSGFYPHAYFDKGGAPGFGER
jgi:hypothetical protein